MAVLLGVDAAQVAAWEALDADMPEGYLSELAAMGLDTATIKRGQPGVPVSEVEPPDEHLLRYCWRGLGREVKSKLLARFFNRRR